MKNLKILTLVISVLCVYTACFKSKINGPKFPLETQSGLNTFGCYIDNKAFIPSTTLFGNVHPLSVYYQPNSSKTYKAGFFSIQGIDARNIAHSGRILIQKQHVFGPGEYPISNIPDCDKPYNCDNGDYYSSKQGISYFIESGKLAITRLDTANKIVSGRFYFTAKDNLGNKKEITGGVFDAKYDQ